MKFKPIPMLLEFILPISMQVFAVLALLFLARESALHTLFAIVACLIWLKVSHNKTVQEAGEIRAARKLFAALGRWSDQEDAARLFDDVMSECLMIDPIESEDTLALVTAWGMANAVRGALSVLLQLYLLVVLALTVMQSISA